MTLVRKTPLAKPLASAAPGHSCGADLQPLASTRDRGGGGAHPIEAGGSYKLR